MKVSKLIHDLHEQVEKLEEENVIEQHLKMLNFNNTHKKTI